jgi:uncharacterized phage-associated protein
MYALTSAAAAGNAFLSFERQESGYPVMDWIKLQSLLFYAHAWSLARLDNPLFNEAVEAWSWGPVVQEIYTQTSHYGNSEVVGNLKKIEFKDGALVTSIPFTDVRTLNFLKSVWDVHKIYTGLQLASSTILPGEPWAVVRETIKASEEKPVIPNTLIMDIFKNKQAIT